MTIETAFEKQQRPFRIRKSLKELVYKPRKSQKYSITLPPFPTHDKNCMEYAYDVLYECQRGSLTVGYSSKTLLQFDPNPWCDADMKFTPMNIENYQLPDPTWEWVSKDWMIDMTEDVDEAGWQYALKFHGADWHGNYKHFRSFVRRRRWIRLRQRTINSDNNSQQLSNTVKTQTLVDVEDNLDNNRTSAVISLDSHQDIMEKLRQCRLDREKLSILDSAIKSTLPGLEDQLLDKAPEYLNYFDYDDSKVKFISRLLTKKYPSNFNKLQLTDQELKAIRSLSFYHDIQTILTKIDPTL